MKYPITPEYLESQPEPIAELYRRLEAYVLADICGRFRVSGEATETALQSIRQLQRRGYDLADIERYIQSTLRLTDAEFTEIMARAVARNQAYYAEALTQTQLMSEPVSVEALQEELDAITRQTRGQLVNITQSMGFMLRGPDGGVAFHPIADTYQRVLDDAAAKVSTGVQIYEQAVKDATDALAASGLQYIEYDTGWHNRVDVAARRAVRTGISQLSGRYADMIAERVPTDYWEVTAHRGARDKPGPSPWSSHKAWQGKVYSVRTGDIYPNIYAVCGYGYVDGLMGANCRHMRHPFWEGISTRSYTDDELENIDPPPFTFEGREYTAYEATQKQRQIETAMRETRRKLIAYDASGQGQEFTAASVRYRRLNEEYESFSKAAGLPTQRDRMRVAGFDNKLGRKATRAARKAEDTNL